ncbi:MAG TPA: hypothetical protein VK929_04190 [Longimicrobiales bacterium]|nr:hypothetical protein [Longimicrobiales bacterium]
MTGRTSASAGAVLLLSTGPLHARQPVVPEAPRPGIEATRVHLGVLPLFGIAGPQDAVDTALSFSGRAVLGVHLTPRFTAYAGGLRVAPMGLELTGGVAGARYTVGSGSMRMGGFAEAGYGELRAARGTQALEYLDDAGSMRRVPLPAYRSARVPGAGAGLEAEYALPGGFLLRGTAGFWRFTENGFGVRHLFGGVGLAWALRDEPWYWWRSGRDRSPPVLAVLSPRADTLDAYDPDTEPLVVVASALSGIAALEVDGQSVVFRRVSDGEIAVPVHGAAVIASLPLNITPGGSERLRLTARDRSGNRVERDLLVLGPAPDLAPPVIVLPDVLRIRERSGQVQGYVLDRSPVTSVVVGGVEAQITPVSRHEVPEEIELGRGVRAARFTVDVELNATEERVTVVAVDSLGHRAEAQVTVMLQEHLEPRLEVFHPDAVSEVTADQVSVMGSVVHSAPLRVVMVGSEPARLREVDVSDVAPERAAPGMRAWLFEATVDLVVGRNRISVLARDGEGFQVITVLEVVRILPPEPQP